METKQCTATLTPMRPPHFTSSSRLLHARRKQRRKVTFSASISSVIIIPSCNNDNDNTNETSDTSTTTSTTAATTTNGSPVKSILRNNDGNDSATPHTKQDAWRNSRRATPHYKQRMDQCNYNNASVAASTLPLPSSSSSLSVDAATTPRRADRHLSIAKKGTRIIDSGAVRVKVSCYTNPRRVAKNECISGGRIIDSGAVRMVVNRHTTPRRFRASRRLWSPPPSTGTKRRHPLRHTDNEMNKSITCIASTTQKHQRTTGITHRDDSGACNNIDDLKPKTLFN